MKGSPEEGAPLRLYFVAGEASGDRIGAELMQALDAACEARPLFFGVGGHAMEAQGLRSLFPMDELSLHGVADVVTALPRLLRRLRETADHAVTMRADAVITIDSQEFSARLMRRLARCAPAIRRIHYVAPTVWAWRPGRARALARTIDSLIAIFPFEPPLFARAGLDCAFVGHPAVARAQAFKGQGASFRHAHGIAPRRPMLFLAPGSRGGEIARHMKPLEAIIDPLARAIPDIAIVIPCAHSVAQRIAQEVSCWRVKPCLLDPVALGAAEMERQKFAAADAADAALVASGTITAELAALETPMLVFYRTDWLTGFLLPRISPLDWASVPNIVAKSAIVPEYLQGRMKANAILPPLVRLLTCETARRAQREALSAVAKRLLGAGREGAAPDSTPAMRAARHVLQIVGEGRRCPP